VTLSVAMSYANSMCPCGEDEAWAGDILRQQEEKALAICRKPNGAIR
jgi:hypothetical protein